MPLSWPPKNKLFRMRSHPPGLLLEPSMDRRRAEIERFLCPTHRRAIRSFLRPPYSRKSFANCDDFLFAPCLNPGLISRRSMSPTWLFGNGLPILSFFALLPIRRPSHSMSERASGRLPLLQIITSADDDRLWTQTAIVVEIGHGDRDQNSGTMIAF